MHSARRYLLIALSLAICMTVFATFAPRIAHAITATLVQVVNTSANPVITAESATRFETHLCQKAGPIATAANACSGANSFTVPMTTSTGVPVKRLVIENASGYCSNYNKPDLQIKLVRFIAPFTPDAVPNGQASFVHGIPLQPPYSYVNDPGFGPPLGGIAENDYTFGQTTSWVFNPGDVVSMGIYYFYSNPSGIADYDCSADLEGRLEPQ